MQKFKTKTGRWYSTFVKLKQSALFIEATQKEIF